MDYKTKLQFSLQTIFDCHKFLNKVQEEAVKYIFKRKGDIFISGYGKSLCYQLPVMVQDNSFIIVITARVPYMKKYTSYFKSKQITTNYLCAATSRKQKNLIQKDIISKESEMKILFITPVQYETAYFKVILKKIDKQRLLGIVIDQADNILSKQGNLCNQYQNLDLKIVGVPIITLISTATAKVQRDVVKNFHLENPKAHAMPVLRANLYRDVKFINIIKNPMRDLTRFIKCWLYSDNCTYSTKEENWGLIVCKDVQTVTRVADSLTSKKIPVLPSDSLAGLTQGRRKKEMNLKNIRDARVILVDENNDILSVTNSLVQKKAPKQLKFIIYWEVLPTVEKYCLLSSRAQCVSKTSFCRVYSEINEVIDKSFRHKDMNSELSTVILNCLEKMQCRHKVYSNFFGDEFTACGDVCDVCDSKEKVENKIARLKDIIDNLNLEKKLQKILKPLKDSSKICDVNSQYKSSQKKIPNHKTESSVNLRVEKENKGDHSRLDKNIAYNNEVICESRVEIDKKANALSELNNIYATQWKTMPCQREIDSSRTSAHEEPTSSKSLCSDAQSSQKSEKEIITISDDDNDLDNDIIFLTEENNNLNSKRPRSIEQDQESIDDNDLDNDIIFLKENNNSNTKRPRSIEQDQESIKQVKRRKLH